MEDNLHYQRIRLVREDYNGPTPKVLGCPGEFATYIRPHFKGAYREKFLSIPLDSRHRALGVHVVSIGTVSSSLVCPREVYLACVVVQASALVVCHNHPSGDPSPSQEDHAVTARLKDAGAVLGITLLDHLILGDGHYYSMEEGQKSRFPEEESWVEINEDF